MRHVAGVAVLAFLLGSCNVQPSAGSAPLSADEQAAIELASTLEKRLKSLRARTALSKSQQAELDTRLDDVRAALARVSRLREQGKSQSVVLGKIGVLAGGLLANDTTGVGLQHLSRLSLRVSGAARMAAIERQGSRLSLVEILSHVDETR